jgi:hypothetical protein
VIPKPILFRLKGSEEGSSVHTLSVFSIGHALHVEDVSLQDIPTLQQLSNLSVLGLLNQ